MEGIGENAPPGRRKERSWGYGMKGIGGNTPPEGRKRRKWGCKMKGMGGNAPPGRRKERNWGVWNGGNEREIYIKQKLMNCIRKGT